MAQFDQIDQIETAILNLAQVLPKWSFTVMRSLPWGVCIPSKE